MSQTTKRHHYLPRFYLAGFTDTSSKDGQLTVFHLLEHRTFQTSTANVGVELHFNRVESPGVEPDAVENALSIVEGQMAEVLREIVETEQLPEGEDMILLLNLIALLFVRNPGARTSVARTEEQVMRVVRDLMVSTPEVYENTVQRAREAGVDISEDLSYEQMRDFIRRTDLELQPDTTRDVLRELEVLGPIIKALAARTWSLLVASETDAEFICCDHPVALTWESGAAHANHPPGLGLKGTLVVMPLTKRLALWSFCNGPDGITAPVPADIVATVNRIILGSAQRFAYASSERASVKWDDGRVLMLLDLMQETKEQQEKERE